MQGWEYKLRFLRKQADGEHTRLLLGRICAWAETEGQTPVAVAHALALDVTYLWCKQARWRASVYFGDFFADYLQKDYGLKRTVAEELYESLHAWDPNTSARSIDEDLDKSFLRAVFVTGAVSQDESELELELGFGRTVMAILRHVIHDLQGNDTGNRLSFSPEINTAFAEIMMAFAAWLRQEPYALEAYRVSLATGAPILGESEADQAARSALFRLIVAMAAARKGASVDQLSRYWQGPAIDDLHQRWLGTRETSLPEVLERMAMVDLCYAVHNGSTARWFPSPWVQNLSAPAVAASIAWPRQLDAAWFKEWNPACQSALVKRMAFERPEDLQRLFQSAGQQWAPETFYESLRHMPGLPVDAKEQAVSGYLASVRVPALSERWRTRLKECLASSPVKALS